MNTPAQTARARVLDALKHGTSEKVLSIVDNLKKNEAMAVVAYVVSDLYEAGDGHRVPSLLRTLGDRISS